MLLAVAPLALLGVAVVIGGAAYLFASSASAAPPSSPAPGGGTTSCPTTPEGAKALGEKAKPEMDAWVEANPIPGPEDIGASRAWFKAFVSKLFSLLGPCGSERTPFARELRRGVVLGWAVTLAMAGKIDEEPEQIAAWFQEHPEYDPLDGMPWEIDPVLDAMMPTATPSPGEAVVEPTMGARVAGAILREIEA